MASLKLQLTTAAGEDLQDHLLVELFALQGSNHQQFVVDINGTATLEGIDIATGPFYRVVITPVNYRIMQSFVSLSATRTTTLKLIVPVDPNKVVNISAPDFDKLKPVPRGMLAAAQVPSFNDGNGGFLQGPALWGALASKPLLKACFLNITAKAAATPLPDGQTVLDHFGGLFRFEQDRLFLATTAALFEETANAKNFHEVSDALHDPMPGYSRARSFKTFDKYGNLQLTFQTKGHDYAVDVDIDDAQGVEHIYQVVTNFLSGPTNPYNIHEILLQQKPVVAPSYDFTFAARMHA